MRLALKARVAKLEGRRDKEVVNRVHFYAPQGSAFEPMTPSNASGKVMLVGVWADDTEWELALRAQQRRLLADSSPTSASGKASRQG